MGILQEALKPMFQPACVMGYEERGEGIVPKEDTQTEEKPHRTDPRAFTGVEKTISKLRGPVEIEMRRRRVYCDPKSKRMVEGPTRGFEYSLFYTIYDENDPTKFLEVREPFLSVRYAATIDRPALLEDAIELLKGRAYQRRDELRNTFGYIGKNIKIKK